MQRSKFVLQCEYLTEAIFILLMLFRLNNKDDTLEITQYPSLAIENNLDNPNYTCTQMKVFQEQITCLVQAALLLLALANFGTMVAAADNCATVDLGDDGETTCLVDRGEIGPIKVIVHGTKNDPFWQQVRAGMEQTASDMNVALDMVLYDDNDPNFDESTMALTMVNEIQNVFNNYNAPRPSALIVSLPGDSRIEEELLKYKRNKIPIFGVNAIGGEDISFLQGTVSMDENQAGKVAGDQIRDLLQARDNGNDKITGLYINHRPDVNLMAERYNALREETEDVVESWKMVYLEKSTTDEEFMGFFEGCKDVVIVLAGGSGIADEVVAAMNANGCNIEDGHILGSFDTSTPLIYDAMDQGVIDFAISQQPHLQGSNSVLMAAMYATTGQKLSGSSVLHTGPILVSPDTESFPAKDQQVCEMEGFPVCSSDATVDSSSGQCSCTERSEIAIAVITHDQSSIFWDTVFSGISQAASDFGVSIMKNRFKNATPPVNNRQRLFGESRASRLKHTFDINEACSSEYTNGLIVSLPDVSMVDSLAGCASRGIPYLAINAAAGIEADLQGDTPAPLIPYVGQKDYESGLEAGKRLVDAGVKKGWCLVHTNFDTINERCRGMEDAFAQNDETEYMGLIHVFGNEDVSLYKTFVEDTIRQEVGDDNWSGLGVGVLSTGKNQIPGLLGLIEDHPEILAGTFDLDSTLPMPDQIVFSIDQNAYMEGYLSVATMVWSITTSETSITPILETGPNFVQPSNLSNYDEQQNCRDKKVQFCGIKPEISLNQEEDNTEIEGERYVEQPLQLSGKCNQLGRKCNVCEGDCNDDTDCGEGLVCYVRDSKTKGQDDPVPGCNTNPIEWTSKDFCVDSRLYQCKDQDWIEVAVGSFSISRTCAYVADDLMRCKEFGRFCRETCGYCRSSHVGQVDTNY